MLIPSAIAEYLARRRVLQKSLGSRVLGTQDGVTSTGENLELGYKTPIRCERIDRRKDKAMKRLTHELQQMLNSGGALMEAYVLSFVLCPHDSRSPCCCYHMMHDNVSMLFRACIM